MNSVRGVRRMRRDSYPEADDYDSIGDPWWFCDLHRRWYHDGCSGCATLPEKVWSWYIGAVVIATIFAFPVIAVLQG